MIVLHLLLTKKLPPLMEFIKLKFLPGQNFD